MDPRENEKPCQGRWWLRVSSKDNRTKIVQHAGHQMRIGWRKKTRFEMAIKENPNTETEMPN
jgi:hypothetical protein